MIPRIFAHFFYFVMTWKCTVKCAQTKLMWKFKLMLRKKVIKWCRTNYYKLRFSFSSAKFLVDYYKRASILLNRRCIFQFLQILIKTSSHHCLKNLSNVFQFLQDNLTSNSINQNKNISNWQIISTTLLFLGDDTFKIRMFYCYDTRKEKEGELLT